MNYRTEREIFQVTEGVSLEYGTETAENTVNEFDRETGRFSECFGEMGFDMSSLAENIYITDGMKNNTPSAAFRSFSNKMRYEIQKSAVELQLCADCNYFRRFGCEEETPAAIVAWFSESKEYTLHETKVHTVQIVDYKTHKDVHHSGGVAQEKSNMISADKRKNYNK